MGAGEETPFGGTKRFEIIRPVGRGGMGVVYEALDREHGARVALKTLRQLTPEALLRFKNEFRALQDVQHPNLITLGELFEHEGQWFFTMELVDGTDLLSYVRPAGYHASAPKQSVPTRELDRRDDAIETTTLPPPAPPGDKRHFDEGRLRAALRQLAAGVNALHRAGKVHRDIKPPNILVTRDDRVVLLDFGVVTDVRLRDAFDDNRIVGTLAYMAPEQAVGLPVGPAADWYSVGIVLFEALTGQRPFIHTTPEHIARRGNGAAPGSVAADVPPDLDELCTRLLRFNSAERPPVGEILRTLGVADASADSRSLSQIAEAVPFVGRTRELAELDKALDACRATRSLVTVAVQGESGVGKSELVRQFLMHARSRVPDVVELSGRCYEREAVPFRAFDAIIDALCHYLARLDQVDAALLLPPQIGLAARIFPVLRRVAAVRKAESGLPDVPDPQELRTRAFRALRGLLANVAAARPLIVFVDDFQWADADSLVLMRELLDPAGAPPLLLVLTVRTGTGADIEPTGPLALTIGARHLDLAGLSPEESAQLAATLIHTFGGTLELDPTAIARETSGHPLFLHELVHHIADAGTDEIVPRLDDALRARIARLEPAARRFLEVVAVSGSPAPLKIVAGAAELDLGEAARQLVLLRHQRLARASGTRASDRVETFHDRVRTAVMAHLDPSTARQLHAAFAEALEEAEPGLRDPHMLVRHLEAAGAIDRAAQQAVQAAGLHEEMLAFEQAADMYRTALRLGSHSAEDRGRLRTRLGHALVNAGRCPEAAEAYLAAAEGANDALRLDLRRRAAEQNLISGHIDRGLQQLRDVLVDVGLKLPATPARALLSLLWHRMRLRLRGLTWKERDSSRIAPRDLERLEVHRAVALGLSFVDNIRGAAFQTRGLLLAMKLGVPSHVARALLLEAGYRATQGLRSRQRLERLLDDGRRLAESSGDPYLVAWATGVRGVCDYLTGHFADASRGLRETERVWFFMPGATWELNHARMLWLLSLRRMGKFRELGELYDEYRRDAVRRGDRLIETTIGRALNQVWLARDQPERGREELERSTWTPETGFLHLQNWYEIESHIELDLYTGQLDRTRREHGDRLTAIGSSLLMRIQIVRTAYWYLCARLILAEIGTGLADPERIAEVSRLARKLERERVPYAMVWAKLLRGQEAVHRRKRARAAHYLREAVLLGEEAHMLLCVAVARCRLGELLGAEEGRPLVDAAMAWMAGEGIHNPARMVELFTPSFTRAP